MTEVNCFTMQAGAPFLQGIPTQKRIPLRAQDGRLSLFVGDIRVPLAVSDDSRPRIDDEGNLERARLDRSGNGSRIRWRVITAKDTYHGLLLYIQTNNLEFDYFPLVDGLNLRVGGDGTPPIVQTFVPNSSRPDEQLFLLEEGKTAVVVDIRGAIVEVGCFRGSITFRRPGVDELISFIEARAHAVRSFKTCDWALGNLRTIAAGGYAKETDMPIRNVQKWRSNL